MSNVVPIREVPSTSEGRVPPSDLVAEAAVLSAIMLDSETAGTLARLRDYLLAEHFYSETHRRIFEAACAVVDAGGRPDMVQVGSRLRESNRLAQVGGMAYLAEILDAAPVVHHVEDYAATVFEAWRAREVIACTQRVAAVGYLGIADVQHYVDQAISDLGAISRQSRTSPVESNLTALKRIVREITERIQGKGVQRYGMPTGLPSLDELTGGLHGSHVLTICALPGVGKTTLALQIASHVALQNIGVLFFSTEQSADELRLKLLSMHGRINHDKFKKLDFTPADWQRLNEGATIAAHLPIWIDDTREIDGRTIRARAVAKADRALHEHKVPLGLIVIDYVQNLAAAPHQDRSKRHEVVAENAKTIKTLARQLKVPVIQLAQRKRPQDGGPKAPRPKLTDISDSSQVEKESDEILFLWRKPDGRENQRTATLSKQRSGAAGESADLELEFQGEFSTFVDSQMTAVRDFVPTGRFDE